MALTFFEEKEIYPLHSISFSKEKKKGIYKRYFTKIKNL
jgi:hypothetical protein